MRDETVSAMCALAYRNMTAILPSDGTKAEDNALWLASFRKGLKEGTKHILRLRGGELLGYLSYTVRPAENEVYLNEVQVAPACQGCGRHGPDLCQPSEPALAEALREAGLCRDGAGRPGYPLQYRQAGPAPSAGTIQGSAACWE